MTNGSNAACQLTKSKQCQHLWCLFLLLFSVGWFGNTTPEKGGLEWWLYTNSCRISGQLGFFHPYKSSYISLTDNCWRGHFTHIAEIFFFPLLFWHRPHMLFQWWSSGKKTFYEAESWWHNTKNKHWSVSMLVLVGFLEEIKFNISTLNGSSLSLTTLKLLVLLDLCVLQIMGKKTSVHLSRSILEFCVKEQGRNHSNMSRSKAFQNVILSLEVKDH